jgi:hypothetical protein
MHSFRWQLPEVLKRAGKVALLIARLYQTPAASRGEIWMRNGTVITQWSDLLQIVS